jgi:hypothetical protein
MSLKPQDRLGPYEIIASIGAGVPLTVILNWSALLNK